jgi:glucose/arabinose dehydrogenase
MRARLIVTVAVAVVLLGACGRTAGSTGGLTSIGAGLRGSAGLAATVYATGLKNVSALAWDAQGRLWAATASYTSDGQDAVYVIAQPGAAPVPVVTGLRTPLGLAWLGDRLYMASVGRVEAFSGLSGAAFAQRQTILDGPVAGSENDGLVVTADGRLLMGVTAPCDHCAPASPLSATIVSFAADGSDLQVYARGIRAPYGLALYPGTADLFATMNQRDDLGSRTPGDWLALVPSASDWRFPDCYGQGGVACADVPAPTAVLDKHAAAGGVAFAGGAAVVAEWATGRVLRVALARGDGSYRATSVTDYLTGMTNPLPALAAGDGALLVGDWATGKVYRIAQ